MSSKFSIIKTIGVHVIVLTVIFFLSLLGFARVINQKTPSMAEDMASSTFPLVYMRNKGVNYNCLHGYAKEMDVNYIRDTVTVLSDDHLLDIQIQPFNTNIENVSYEVLSLDGMQSLENTNVINLTEDNNFLTAQLKIQNTMMLQQEYILKIQVTAGGRDIYYYTRFLLEDGLHLEAYLDFVTGFYEKCVNKSDQTSLGTVVEPDASTDETRSLAVMDIHDSVFQLMWGNLNPQIYYKPTPSLVDINGTTASFVLDYRISAVNKEGISEVFNVKEFYRLRYTDTRIFLLDFTRSTEEIFNPDKSVLTSNGINLGISDGEEEYCFDDHNRVVAFVRENELWSYRINGKRLTRIFGFPQDENMDYRDFYDKNNIKILRVDNKGNVWFAVAGYMNRGNREGENGVGIYYYEEASSTVKEILFIETMESYDSLSLDINAMTYITDNQENCYILLEDIIYRINLNTGAYEKVVDGVCKDCYASSETNRYFSWLKEEKRYQSRTLYTIDFETVTTREITCGEDEYMRPLCYMNENLVYGVAKKEDVNIEDEGNELYPMYQLKIIGEDGSELKTYQPDQKYVMSITKINNTLLLDRTTKIGNEFRETTEDHIVNADMEEDVVCGIATKEDKNKQTEIYLRVGTEITDTQPQIVTSKLLISDRSDTIQIASNPDKEKLYYVYAGGKMESKWPTAAEAIRRADSKVGVVINDAKEFVWERGNRAETGKIMLEDIPDIVKTGTMDTAVLEATLGREVVSLTGCSLDQVLYFIGQKHPVIGATPNGSVIITGYDDYGNLILLNPGETETYFYGPQDSQEMFATMGNRFISYLNTETGK